MLTLVIGGARSGKSRFAISLCPLESRVTYIATAPESDDEMRSRIARHRRDRPSHWKTVEEPLALASIVAAHASTSDFVIVDCLTLWLSNLCWERRESGFGDLEQSVSNEIAEFGRAAATGQVILVSNEVGCSLVPDSPLGRSFQDLQGLTNQWAAREADVVYQTIAGIPIKLKSHESRGQNIHDHSQTHS